MENHVNQPPAIPKWSALLIEAVTKPGLIMKLTVRSINTAAQSVRSRSRIGGASLLRIFGSWESRVLQRLHSNLLRRWSGLNADAIPEKSAQKVFRAADLIIRGRTLRKPSGHGITKS